MKRHVVAEKNLTNDATRLPQDSTMSTDTWCPVFAMQIIASVAGLGLGVSMLASGRGDPAVYLPIVAGIVGYWLPAPLPSRGTVRAHYPLRTESRAWTTCAQTRPTMCAHLG